MRNFIETSMVFEIMFMRSEFTKILEGSLSKQFNFIKSYSTFRTADRGQCCRNFK